MSREYDRSAHDVYCGMLLEGYAAATRQPTSADSGLAIVLFMIFIFTYDREFERRRSFGEPIAFPEIMGSPATENAWSAFGEYCRCFPGGGLAVDAVEHQFHRSYQKFCHAEEVARGARDLPSTLRLVELDSGLTLTTVYEVLRVFNRHDPDEDCKAQFHAVGMAGKLLDDMRDVAEDFRAGVPNLYFAATAGHESERRVLESAIREREPLSSSWLRRNCPNAFADFTDLTVFHYRRVSTPQLRLPLDICWALVGLNRYWRRPIRRSPEVSP